MTSTISKALYQILCEQRPIPRSLDRELVLYRHTAVCLSDDENNYGWQNQVTRMNRGRKSSLSFHGRSGGSNS
ncbi:hypothetical protein GOP47_0000660 [Adiantum capillus-veneris]|uniref:Uncharacterized protein n=1 Tax=Adiantum capillus-veneris TaxID=13818 RepID=A0A9D4ZSI3_ADICA|nr:hypothetical protein GOP47_0000660 [Adiantum capillus-veneris]